MQNRLLRNWGLKGGDIQGVSEISVRLRYTVRSGINNSQGRGGISRSLNSKTEEVSYDSQHIDIEQERC